MDEEWWTYWTYEVSLCITIYIYVPLSRSEHWYFRKVARRPQGTKYFSYPTCQWLFWWKLKQIYTHLLHMPFLPRTPRPLQFPDVGSWCLGKWTSAIEHKCAKSTMFKILDGVELGRPFWSVIPREGPLEWQKTSDKPLRSWFSSPPKISDNPIYSNLLGPCPPWLSLV